MKLEISEVADIMREQDKTRSARMYAQVGISCKEVKNKEDAFDYLEKAIGVYEEMYICLQSTKNIECLCNMLEITATLYRNNFFFHKAISLHEKGQCVAGETESNKVECR
jgi:hypothetical protein